MRLFASLSTAVATVAVLASPALGQSALATSGSHNPAVTTDDARVLQLGLRIEPLVGDRVVPKAAIKIEGQLQLPPEAERRISALEQKVAELQKAQEPPASTAMSGETQERTLTPVGLASFYDDGYLVVTSRDGAFKYWLDGRVQVDMATYKGALNRLPTGAEARRARIGVKATLFTNWLSEIDLDFIDNAIEIKDLWMGYAGFANSIIRVGNHKSPFGFDTLTSSKNIVFMERAYVDAWSPDRLLGVSYSRWGAIWQLSAGVFGQPAGDFNDKDSLTGGGAGTSQGHSFVGRFSIAPLHAKGRVLHVGIAAARRTPDANKIATSGADLPDRLNASRVVKLDSRAETHVSRAKFLSTGDMKYVDHTTQLGVEVAGVMQRVTFQAEYQRSQVARIPTQIASLANHHFSGYYGQVSVFLTKDQRQYSVSEGEFLRIVPARKSGAVEVAARYSTLNLTDNTDVDPVLGGSAKNMAIGVAWFMNVNHKIMFNVTHVSNDNLAKPGKDWAPLPTGTSTTMTPVTGDTFWTIAVRYQIAF